MVLSLPTAESWAKSCASDGEFKLAARHWNGSLTLRIGDRALGVIVRDGVPEAGSGAHENAIELSGPSEVWARVLAATPPPYHNDLMAALTTGVGLSLSADPVAYAQYYAAVMRAIELLRPASDGRPVREPARKFDSPIGRYVHLTLGGHDHRIYFEEAGEGIPLLMQHTAGCHGSQWRHLFEDESITRRFRLIAYDLPYHGKSMPPPTKAWWSEPYRLQGEFLRSVPVELAEMLELDRPVFMGCSVGGLLALDLAYRHADTFRAVISVEGALKVEGDLTRLSELWHPQVSNEYKARAMEGLVSPTSPLPYRKETGFVYSTGWPPAFLGDLYYYIADFDLRDVATQIDTRRVGVHILSGEYDWSGRVDLGREAHQAIRGSTFAEMKGVGHFPMSEHPAAFLSYLKPVLARIA